MRAYHKLGAGRFSVADLRAVDPLGALACRHPAGRLATRRDHALHRAALHLLPQLRVGGRGAGRARATGCTWRPIARKRTAAASWWTAWRRGFPAQVTVGFTPILQWGRYRRVSRRAAARARLPALFRPAVRGHAEDPRARLRADAVLRRWRWRACRGAAPVTRALERLEQAVPRQVGVDEFVGELRPDVLLITPLIELGSPQLDYVRAARALGIRSALCVWSWDHLSSKALIRVVPDRVIVWNETQRDEAQRFHGIAAGARASSPARSASTSGSTGAPSRDRDAFCGRVGLPTDAAVPALRLLGALQGQPVGGAVRASNGSRRSARSPDPRAARRCRSWCGRIRSALEEWQPATCRRRSTPTGAWCCGARTRSTPTSRADYFDSMYHAAAVVGLNTSALVESAIVDRPVFTRAAARVPRQPGRHVPLPPPAARGRRLPERVARRSTSTSRSWPAMLAGGAVRPNRPFVEQFIRPRGTGVAATPVFVDALEAMAARRRRRGRNATPLWVLGAAPAGVRSGAGRSCARCSSASTGTPSSAARGRERRGDRAQGRAAHAPSGVTRRTRVARNVRRQAGGRAMKTARQARRSGRGPALTSRPS